jgi:hypothetical protein
MQLLSALAQAKIAQACQTTDGESSYHQNMVALRNWRRVSHQAKANGLVKTGLTTFLLMDLAALARCLMVDIVDRVNWKIQKLEWRARRHHFLATELGRNELCSFALQRSLLLPASQYFSLTSLF